MVRQTLKILQHLLQDFKSLSDHFGALCIKGLNFAELTFFTMTVHLKLYINCGYLQIFFFLMKATDFWKSVAEVGSFLQKKLF